MQFAMLGSGSGGNGTLVRAGATTLLVDCGFMLRETEARLARLGVDPRQIDAVMVTHEHADHVGGVARFARKWKLPVWLSAGTRDGWKDGPVPRTHCFVPGMSFSIGDITVHPFPVPHDAREPCQYVFSDGTRRVGVLSDAGSVTDAMRDALSGCDALMLEFNHDVHMLEVGPYPKALRERVGGPVGHLSNVQSAELLTQIDISKLKHLVLTHLSLKNNTPELALSAARSALEGFTHEIICARQDTGLEWRVLA